MNIRGEGVDYHRVVDLINKVGREQYDNNIVAHNDTKPLGNNNYGFQGRIIGVSSNGPGTRRSWSGRRGPWACWHSYRDVLAAIFDEYPNAKIKTAMAFYDGKPGFYSTYPGTANINIGSQARPAFMSELCDCEDYE